VVGWCPIQLTMGVSNLSRIKYVPILWQRCIHAFARFDLSAVHFKWKGPGLIVNVPFNVLTETLELRNEKCGLDCGKWWKANELQLRAMHYVWSVVTSFPHKLVSDCKLLLTLCIHVVQFNYISLIRTVRHLPFTSLRVLHAVAWASGSVGHGWPRPTQTCILPTQSQCTRFFVQPMGKIAQKISLPFPPLTENHSSKLLNTQPPWEAWRPDVCEPANLRATSPLSV